MKSFPCGIFILQENKYWWRQRHTNHWNCPLPSASVSCLEFNFHKCSLLGPWASCPPFFLSFMGRRESQRELRCYIHVSVYTGMSLPICNTRCVLQEKWLLISSRSVHMRVTLTKCIRNSGQRQWIQTATDDFKMIINHFRESSRLYSLEEKNVNCSILWLPCH